MTIRETIAELAVRSGIGELVFDVTSETRQDAALRFADNYLAALSRAGYAVVGSKPVAWAWREVGAEEWNFCSYGDLPDSIVERPDIAECAPLFGRAE